MYSDYNCCHFWCCIYNQDPEKPWNKRHTCGKSTWCGLKIGTWILGIIVGFTLFVLLLLAIGEVGKYFFDMKSLCNYDGPWGIFLCSIRGFMYLAIVFMNGATISFLLWPIYHLLYTTWDWKIAVKFGIAMIPMYLVGPEFFGILATHIIRTDWIYSTCNFTSYYQFMNVSCNVLGNLLGLAICIVGGIGYYLYTLVKCICTCYDETKQIQSTYGTIGNVE